VTALARDFGFAPRTPLEDGLGRFVDWYRGWRVSVGRAAA
jgi:UDP-glucuronate 4-epimerase